MTSPFPHHDAGSDLARWARERDRAALDRLVEASLDRIYSQARRLLGNDADARDATQEAVLQLMRSAQRYDPSRPFAPWLACHVHDACLRLLRSRGRRVRRERAAAVPPPEPEPVDGEGVRAAVADLPERDRAAIDLHYFAGLTQADASSALGISENAFAVRLHRARERLRGLLQRRGVTVGAAGVLAALASPPAYGAPASVVAGAQALAGGGALPSTTIPLSAVQHGARLATRHPIAMAGLSFALVIVSTLALWPDPDVIPPALVHAEPPPVPVPAVAAQAYWAEPARGLLAWIDPAAGFQLAADGEALRRLALTAKPTSLLADPRGAAAIGRLRQQLDLLEAWGDGDGIALGVRLALAAPALVTMVRPDRVAHPRFDDRYLSILHAGAMTERIARYVADVAEVPGMRPVAVAGFTGFAEGNVAMLGISGARAAYGSTDWLARRAAAFPAAQPTPAQLRAPAWMHLDAGPIVAAYAALDRAGDDPVGLGLFLGSGWRGLKPRVDAELTSTDGIWQGRGVITGAIPVSPCLTLALLQSLPTVGLRSIISPGISGFAALPLRTPDPALLPPPTAGALLRLTLGSSPEALPAVARQGLMELHAPMAAAIAEWSGDLTLEVVNAMPLPTVSAVLGRRAGSDGVAVRTLMTELGAVATAPPAGIDAAWSLASPLGPVQALLSADRLVITSAADGTPLLARGTVAVAGHLVLDIDLPAIARTWLPLAQGLLARERLPLLSVFTFSDLRNAMSDALEGIAARGAVDIAQALKPQLLDQLAPLAPAGGDLGKRFAFYAPAEGTAKARAAAACWVWRDQLGFHLITRGSNGSQSALDGVALERALGERVRLLGDAPADLLAFPERPVLDARCLPPVAVIVDHLPTYHLEWSSTPDGARFSERGLPLAAGLVGIVAVTLALEADPAGEHAEAVAFRRKQGVFKAHAAELQVLGAVARAWKQGLPPRPSQTTVAGGLAAFAPLFAGRIPTAAEVDALGTWHGDGGPQVPATVAIESQMDQHWLYELTGPAVWSVPLGDGWTAHVYQSVVGIAEAKEAEPVSPQGNEF